MRSRDRSYWGNEPPPFTLGHEIARWVDEVGSGVTKFRHGDAVNHCLYQNAISRFRCRL